MKEPESGNEDHDLIRRIQAGDSQAFTELVKKHKEKAVQLAYLTIRNYEDAAEIAQDAFVKAHRSIGRFRFESRFSTWFYRILINTSRDYMRRKSWSRLFVRQQHDEDKNPVNFATDSSPTPGRKVLNAELDREIRDVVTRLPEKQRWVFTLRFYENMSLNEIAEATGMAEGTVKATLHFAIQKFKSGIAPYLKKGESHE